MSLQHGETLAGGLFAYDSGITDTLVADIGGQTTVYSLSAAGVTAFEIGTGGALSQIGSRAFLGPFQPGVTPRLALAEQGADTLLLVAGQNAEAAGAIRLNPDGTPGADAGLSGYETSLIAPVSVAHTRGRNRLCRYR